MKFIVDLFYGRLWSKNEFCEYWFSDSYTLLGGIKEFLCVLAVFWADLDGIW